MKIANDIQAEINRIIRENLADKVVDVRMTMGIDSVGEDGLFIHVYLREDDLTEENYKKMPGIGLEVIEAMGEEMDDVFPYIRVRVKETEDEAHA